MRKSIQLTLAASCVLALFASFQLGATVAEARIVTQEQDAWSEVRVFQNGTLVANPAALSPVELADAKIVSPFEDLQVVYCSNGETYINPTPGECPNFKEIHNVR